MKSHYHGPVFIHEFELAPTPAATRVLGVRLDMARQFYNAMLGECHKRLRKCRQDPRWEEAKSLRHAGAKAQAGKCFDEIKKTYGYSEIGLNDVASGWRQNCFREHLDSQTCYDIAKRAFRACEAFRKDRTHRKGKRRRIRFRRRGAYHTISSNTIKVDAAQHTIHWWGLHLPYLLDTKDVDGLQAYVLDVMANPDNIRFYGKRITQRIVRGAPRHYVQLTLKGTPFQKAKHPVAAGAVGIDVGPSTVAIVAGNTAHGLSSDLRILAEGCQRDERAVRRLQRYLDRARRATNPTCFDDQGRWRKGQRATVVSKRAQRAQQQLQDQARRLAERRKRAHNALVHAILAKGTDIKAEDLSYKGWQRGLFGKSVGKRAPGAFVARLRQQAKTVGGTFTDIETRQTKFSQFCHGCGTYEKKGLQKYKGHASSLHHCRICGLGPLDRDIYSAFLAHQYSGDTTRDPGAVRAAFAVLQYGATGVQGATQATSKELLPPSPNIPDVGESSSGATVTMPDAEVYARTAPRVSVQKVSGDSQSSIPLEPQQLRDGITHSGVQEVLAPLLPQQPREIAEQPGPARTVPRRKARRSPRSDAQLSFFQEPRIRGAPEGVRDAGC